MSSAEQFRPEFLKMNPKHEVPVFDHNGKFITESREIAKYFHENFNMAPEENDHWYPSDSEERKRVKNPAVGWDKPWTLRIKQGEYKEGVKHLKCERLAGVSVSDW